MFRKIRDENGKKINYKDLKRKVKLHGKNIF